MYQPGFVNRFVNNALRKEKRRREVKPDWETQRREKLGRRALKKKKKKREHLGGCGVRDCLGQTLLTPLSHLLLPLLKPASAQFGPVLALVTPPARTILHHTPTHPLTGPTDGITPSV